ncbi:ATP-dependent zinc metalloprotease FtsH 3 [Zostera marina]|uniref:ATP-dependent zinc metalloprotease FtsH 3 n=1 Tax=Zostera marina TaxID=29655 RepID=A0A0K9P649_ZOSMR|nr:ATP-dependent zinc metalloprotease FtsH 3 [Zostera marina]
MDEGLRFSDLGGINDIIEGLINEVIVPLVHPQIPAFLGVRPITGILFHGPPGCGKTSLAHAIARETELPFYKISAADIVSGVSGESEGNIHKLFSKAHRTAPSIIFIDEIDAIASKRENMQKDMERRIVSQLLICMDELNKMLSLDSDSDSSEKKLGYVLVIGATNRPDSVDRALRRPGRFDREIALGVPDENARQTILSLLIKKLRIDGSVDLQRIAKSTPGLICWEIIDRRTFETDTQEMENDRKKDLWKQSWTPEDLSNLHMIMSDLEEAVKFVQPSLRREGFSSIPNVKWDDVGGLTELKNKIVRGFIQNIKSPEVYEEYDVKSQTGFLMYGPLGCGKTLMAKAIAIESGANFIHIKGPELLNKFVGESEKAVRTIFINARTCKPCIIFFDKIDALTSKRGKDSGSVCVLNQLLGELNGSDEMCGVYVIGATNRVDVIDEAILRPGRLGKVVYVSLPNAEERVSILKTLARKKPIAADVDFDTIGRSEACNHFSGADLAELMNEAASIAIHNKLLAASDDNTNQESLPINASYFEQALQTISPSVSMKERSYYENLSQNLSLKIPDLH